MHYYVILLACLVAAAIHAAENSIPGLGPNSDAVQRKDALNPPAQPAPRPELRVMQVDSWGTGILTSNQVEELVSTCRDNNLNTIMAEVRKVGDADYNSSIEPRATNISPDFDPLAYLLQLGHDTSGGRKRIAIHGWFVMHRISRGEPLDTRHVLMQHPDYEMVKRDGSHTQRNRYLDPGHPGTVDHNIAVILDCLSRYDIDGINCDYIRYPEDEGDWGYNPVSVARFNACYGKTGLPDPKDPDWAAWRRECVSLELKKLYVKAWKLKPRVLVTCDTINWGDGYRDFSTSRAYTQAMQDWVGWLRQTLFDYNSLMNYTRTTDKLRFQEWSKLSMSVDAQRGSIIGIGAYMQASIQDSLDLLLWLRQQGAAGFFIYDWHSEVQGNRKGETREQFYEALKKQVTPAWVDLPEAGWKIAPTKGILEGTVASEGQPVDHASVMLKDQPDARTVTDGSGWFAILNVKPGSYSLEVSKSGMEDRSTPATVRRGGEFATLTVELKRNGR